MPRHLRPKRDAGRKLTLLVHARWTYDAARAGCSPGELGDVTREGKAVLVLHDSAGDVLTRYAYREAGSLAHIERRAFVCLVEL